MDELLNHCIRELAFEGDLGCDVNRLRGFISDFYTHTGAAQTVDTAYCTFVWSVVVQHPEVRVGIAPDGAPEVYVAPQFGKVASATKGKKKKTEGDYGDDTNAVGKLEIIEDAALRPLDDLKREYGDKLRIAVDSERSLVAITGSHIKSSKLTPMVYTALQLISRGREAGLSAVDLSKKTGYDAKACHYLIDKLVDLNFIEKRKKSGVGTNICIHKYFFERSELWKGVLAEEGKVRQAATKKEERDDADLNINMDSMDDPAAPTSTHGLLYFEPINSQHLSSLTIIKDRLDKLLRSSPHYMHTAQNLLVTIGFSNPMKADRRFFQTRLRELMAQGFIEKVQVPRPDGKFVPCVRLLNPEKLAQPRGAPAVIEVADDEDDFLSLKTNFTLHKQAIDLIHQSGAEGLTLNQLCQMLGSFDKRAVDHQLNRLKDAPLPGHIRDLGIIQVTETYGRERRYKYFTLQNYLKVVEREKLEAQYPEGFLDAAGGFLPVEAGQFYTTSAELDKHVDSHEARQKGAAKGGKKSKGKEREVDSFVPKTPARNKKRKRGDDDTDDVVEGAASGHEASLSMAPPPKKKRGRPPKAPLQPPETATAAIENGVSASPHAITPLSTTQPLTSTKKRGRPRKNPLEVPTVPKKRGRPPKKNAAHVEAAMNVVAVSSDPCVVEPESSNTFHEGRAASPSTARGGDAISVETSLIAEELVAEVPTGQGISLEQQVTTSVMVSEPTLTAVLQASAPLTVSTTTEVSGAQGLVEQTEQTEPAAPVNVDVDDLTPDRHKRTAPSPPSSPPPSKRLKTANPLSGLRRMTNLSQSRREKEILRLITEMGGIVNASSKEFLEGHASLLETLLEAGEAVSDNRLGSRIDKKTVDTTLKALQDQGTVKFISTAVHGRQVKVAYLVETAQDDVNVFLTGLSRSVALPFTQPPVTKKLDNPMPYGGTKFTRIVKPRKSTFSVAFVEQPPGVEQLSVQDFASGDEAKLKARLLTDPQTIKQLYGFITGKIARIRELHLHVMKLFDENANSHIVSSSHKVLHISYFHRDLPISLYSAIVSSQVPIQELKELLSTPEGRATPLCNVSTTLADALELNKARCRSRILDSLVALRNLHLITPLVSTESGNPWLRCSSNGNYPTAFEATQCDGSTSLQTPQYWRFNTTVPIHLWAMDETSPPFWMGAGVQSHAEAVVFWRQLQRASIDRPYAERLVEEWEQNGLPPNSGSIPANVPVKLVRLLRRGTQWRPSYVFSDNQKQVLKRYTNFQTGVTPLQDVDGGNARLVMIADIVSAPRGEVEKFYQHERSRMLHDIEKMRRKQKTAGNAENSKRRTDTDERANLAQKAAEARAQRERDWEEMLSCVHPEPLKSTVLTRVKNVRKRFLQSAGTDRQKWEAEIAAAVEQNKIPAKRATASRLPLVPQHPIPPSVPRRANEKSVEELIALQGPALAKQEATAKSKKGKEKEGAEARGSRRRYRFTWTKEFEELARDSSAVIRARARDCKRLDWGALEQVFRAVPRNTVRQRIAQLRDQPGAEAYFKRLEDKWFELWTKYRGTVELPDEDPASISNFDLAAHITFLREHVDKNALRVGFVGSEEDLPSIALPCSISALTAQFDVIEKPMLAPTYDFMWNNAAEEGREKLLVQHPFVLSVSSAGGIQQALQARAYSFERAYVGDAALKMTLGTPSDIYDVDHATELLRSAGKEAVDVAVKDMLERGVVSKLLRDPNKNKPGRVLKISDQNQNALGGFFAAELFQDASAFEEALGSSYQDDPLAWREWPLIATDGDAAVLIELVSEGKLDFKIDTSGAQAARAKIDWNSKKADDDDIETNVHLRCRQDPIHYTAIGEKMASATPAIRGHRVPSRPAPIEGNDDDGTASVVSRRQAEQVCQSPANFVMETELAEVHGKTRDGEKACCRQEMATWSGGAGTMRNLDMAVDCQACLHIEVASSADGDELSSKIWATLVDAGESGIAKQKLKILYNDVERSRIVGILEQLVVRKLAFWTGYRDVVLVSAYFLKYWTVVIPFEASPRMSTQGEPATLSDVVDSAAASTNPIARVLPRRWLNVDGGRIPEVWEAVCRAVIGTVVLRPGISQAELRWRLRTVYDRAEIHDVLAYLFSCKQLCVQHSRCGFIADSPADDTEETERFWFLGERRWYDL
ncbi:hypothetical protein BC835DRAFT_1311874 [Cytidiella melzeri]|nr:hypothetical protein BC835DRAFT_1311874 [Cytidiella melzeri]